MESMAAHQASTTSVAFDPSGLYLATASHDQVRLPTGRAADCAQSIRVWDVATRKIVQVDQLAWPCWNVSIRRQELDCYQTHRQKHSEAIHCVRFHASLPLASSAGADAAIKLYSS